MIVKLQTYTALVLASIALLTSDVSANAAICSNNHSGSLTSSGICTKKKNAKAPGLVEAIGVSTAKLFNTFKNNHPASGGTPDCPLNSKYADYTMSYYHRFVVTDDVDMIASAWFDTNYALSPAGEHVIQICYFQVHDNPNSYDCSCSYGGS